MVAPLLSPSAGRVAARMLAGAWRRDPEPLCLSPEELALGAPLLLSTGAAALLWRRIEPLDPPQPRFISDLQAGYRKYMIEAAVHEIEVKDIFERMRAAGIEPLLFKGWALARLYPDPGLRPYGDIDLWFPPEQLEAHYYALPKGNEVIYCVDAHTSFYPQYERTFEDVMDSSQLVPLDDVEVRVPSAEDHLRFICLHFLFHGGWRPLWLCDIALAVESRPSNFDWDRCLFGKQKHADWIACVIGLAHQLLGATVEGTPVEKRAGNLPQWLVPAVLRQWSNGPGMSFTENLSFSLPRRLLRPSALWSALTEHWRNPIQASVEMNAWFSESPRSLLQFGSAFLRVPAFLRYFGREIRRN
jgi:hypothetical protein